MYIHLNVYFDETQIFVDTLNIWYHIPNILLYYLALNLMFHYDPSFASLIAFYLSPTMAGVLLCVWIFIFFAFMLKYFSSSRFMLMFDLMYEKAHTFYGDILGKDASMNMKLYITSLFFVILFANLIGLIISFIAPIFGMNEQWDFILSQYIIMPTSDMQFNIALSLFSTLLLIYVQFGTLWYKKFIYNYFPIWGKGYIEIQRRKMSALIYHPIFLIAKLGDIIVSLFLGFLDFVGLLAKIISLAFRLFWNMTSGTILLAMLLIWLNNFTQWLTGFVGGINFPILAPLLVYAQGLLVAVIQAMVFPLLVAIFIRMAMMETV